MDLRIKVTDSTGEWKLATERQEIHLERRIGAYARQRGTDPLDVRLTARQRRRTWKWLRRTAQQSDVVMRVGFVATKVDGGLAR